LGIFIRLHRQAFILICAQLSTLESGNVITQPEERGRERGEGGETEREMT